MAVSYEFISNTLYESPESELLILPNFDSDVVINPVIYENTANNGYAGLLKIYGKDNVGNRFEISTRRVYGGRFYLIPRPSFDLNGSPNTIPMELGIVQKWANYKLRIWIFRLVSSA